MDDIERANEDIKGVWALESMQYKDSTGMIKEISGSNVTLTFLNDKTYISANDSGFQIIEGDTMFFSYYITPDCCNFSFHKSYFDLDGGYYKNWPLFAIGRKLVYDFNKTDKKTIEFSADWEYDYVNNRKIYNTSYLYTKIDK